MQFRETTSSKRLPRFVPQILLPALCLLLAAFAGQTASAQTFSASISGTVTDSSGAVVPAAQLQLRNINTQDIRVERSDTKGSYTFQNLLPGTYEITVTAGGFEKFIQSNMVLEASTAATVNISLRIGTAEERVVVSGSSVLLNTEDATNSVTLDSQLIQALPQSTLQPLNFVYDLAGTTAAQGGMTSRSISFDQYGSTFGINGGRSGESEILIDGAPSTAIDWGGLMVSPIQASVQEQQVIDNVYDAQYERAGEGVVTLITKSGGPHFHGEAYDYMLNSGLNANLWSNDLNNAPKGKFHREQFGADTGGPLWASHHLFFFGGYEGLRQPETDNSGLDTMPTPAEVKGDFSHTYNSQGQEAVIYNPFSSTVVTDSEGNTYYTRTAFPDNMIPPGLINSVGQKIAGLYATPNRPNSTQTLMDSNNYYKQGPGTTDNDKFDWRIDWSPGEKNRMFVRMSDRVRENNTPACFLCNGADETANNDDHGLQVVFNDTWTPNAKWLINGYGGFTRWWEGQTSIGYGVANASSIGLSPSLFQVNLLPLVNATGYYTLGSTYSSYDRYIRYNSTGIIDVTRQMGQHTIKFGFNYDVAMINNREDSPGNFNFDTSSTACDPDTDSSGNPIPGAPCRAPATSSDLSGNAIASMLLGVGTGGSSDISMDPAMSQHSFGMYLEDEWRATPRLTVNAGLRYENQRPATERHNRVAYFDPTAINPISAVAGSTYYGEFQYAGVDGRSRYEWEPDNLNFGPRAGFAYRFTNKIVGRGGAGIFYGPTSAMLSFDDGGQSPGYTGQTNWIATNNGGYTPENLVSDPFPQGIQQPTGNSQGALTLVGSGDGQIWVKGPHPVGTLYQWSADIQDQLSNNNVFEIGYTGVRGRHLLFGNPNLDLDQMPDKYLSLGFDALTQNVTNPLAPYITNPNYYLSQSSVAYNALLRPYPEYGWLQQTRSTPGADSQFDALAAKFNHTFNSGLSSITTYQWSKNMDDGSEALLGWTINNMWRDATNPKLDYAVSTHDVPQSFAEAFLYQLPYGHDRRWGASSNQWLNQSVGGWNLAGDFQLATGLPLPNPVQFSYNPIADFGFPGNGLPDLVGNPELHRSRAQWINPAAFAGSGGDDTTGTVSCAEITNSYGTYSPCQPFYNRYGNEPQRFGTLREAPTKNFDFSLAKNFGTERVNTQFRADFLNAFNHPIYGGSYNIGNTIDYGDVGDIFGTRNDPRNIQVSLTISY